MNGEIYRLNIRFDLTDECQRSIAGWLQSLDRKQYGSINKFIIAAIGKAFDSNGSSCLCYAQLSERSILLWQQQTKTKGKQKKKSQRFIVAYRWMMIKAI
ncbi:MAG TPA: hypothetical protein IAC40_08110 [Candidatus Faecivivens stercorigallinarum]|nr:hypothetical protein [Candidatus Faecivivens stercorigallinarum]